MSRFREMLDEVGMTPGEFWFGVFSAAVLVACVGGIAWIIAGAVSAASRAAVSSSHYATTFRHDGHLFVRSSRGCILHHPGCQCEVTSESP